MLVLEKFPPNCFKVASASSANSLQQREEVYSQKPDSLKEHHSLEHFKTFLSMCRKIVSIGGWTASNITHISHPTHACKMHPCRVQRKKLYAHIFGPYTVVSETSEWNYTKCWCSSEDQISTSRCVICKNVDMLWNVLSGHLWMYWNVVYMHLFPVTVYLIHWKTWDFFHYPWEFLSAVTPFHHARLFSHLLLNLCSFLSDLGCAPSLCLRWSSVRVVNPWNALFRSPLRFFADTSAFC